jgi:HD superfamily phosphohydrolase
MSMAKTTTRRAAASPEELGYFYDTIHGRIAVEELPIRFRPALKSALSSPVLARLKRISQLGHTSVSFFSATHTRFSHAIGTTLVMNKLFRHVCNRGLSPTVFRDVTKYFGQVVKNFADARDMVHCHLLLAALYQDSGELPFQKVTSLHFVPVEADVRILVDNLPQATPREWTGKQVFSALSLLRDLRDGELKTGFVGYSFEFLAYLISGGDGAPRGAQALDALLQMVDGVIDADRLDYVYRDASVTIGSWSRPNSVLESIVAYEPNHVVVNDSRPVTDFLSTRMRLWSFVYSSADVRFRQVLLKTLLDGRWDSDQAEAAFRAASLEPELPYERFLKLDDVSLIENIERLDASSLQQPYRRLARTLLLRGTLDYESRVLRRTDDDTAKVVSSDLPAEMFFDLLSDHGHHQLYRSESVVVRQELTAKIAKTIRLEESAGAFSPLFAGKNSAMLVADGYYVFLPRERQGGRWPDVERAIESGTLYPLVRWEEARRGVPQPDTRVAPGFSGVCVSISYSLRDFPTVVRIVRDLHRRRRKYRLFLRPFDGTGGTPGNNSGELIHEADAVLAVVSVDYLERAVTGSSYIAIEVRAMHDRALDIPIVPLGVDRRTALDAVEQWDWAQMNEAWRGNTPVLSEDLPLRTASEEVLRQALDEALRAIDRGKRKS